MVEDNVLTLEDKVIILVFIEFIIEFCNNSDDDMLFTELLKICISYFTEFICVFTLIY